MSTESERRRRFEQYKTSVSYECDECGLLIEGYSGDPQETPWLYCPECDVEMNFAAEVDYE